MSEKGSLSRSNSVSSTKDAELSSARSSSSDIASLGAEKKNVSELLMKGIVMENDEVVFAHGGKTFKASVVTRDGGGILYDGITFASASKFVKAVANVRKGSAELLCDLKVNGHRWIDIMDPEYVASQNIGAVSKAEFSRLRTANALYQTQIQQKEQDIAALTARLSELDQSQKSEIAALQNAKQTVEESLQQERADRVTEKAELDALRARLEQELASAEQQRVGLEQDRQNQLLEFESANSDIFSARQRYVEEAKVLAEQRAELAAKMSLLIGALEQTTQAQAATEVTPRLSMLESQLAIVKGALDAQVKAEESELNRLIGELEKREAENKTMQSTIDQLTTSIREHEVRLVEKEAEYAAATSALSKSQDAKISEMESKLNSAWEERVRNSDAVLKAQLVADENLKLREKIQSLEQQLEGQEFKHGNDLAQLSEALKTSQKDLDNAQASEQAAIHQAEQARSHVEGLQRRAAEEKRRADECEHELENLRESVRMVNEGLEDREAKYEVMLRKGAESAASVRKAQAQEIERLTYELKMAQTKLKEAEMEVGSAPTASRGIIDQRMHSSEFVVKAMRCQIYIAKWRGRKVLANSLDSWAQTRYALDSEIIRLGSDLQVARAEILELERLLDQMRKLLSAGAMDLDSDLLKAVMGPNSASARSAINVALGSMVRKSDVDVLQKALEAAQLAAQRAKEDQAEAELVKLESDKRAIEAEQKIEERQKVCDELAAKIEFLNKELENKATDVITMLQNFEAENEALRKELDSLKLERVSLDSQIRTLAEQSKPQSDLLTSKDTEIAEYREKLSNSHNQKLNLDKEILALKQKVQSLERDFLDNDERWRLAAEASHKAYHNTIALMNKSMKELQSENLRLLGLVETRQGAANGGEYAKLLEEVTKERQTWEADTWALRRKAEETATAITQLEEKIRHLSEENSALQGSLEAQKQCRQKLVDEMSQLREKLVRASIEGVKVREAAPVASDVTKEELTQPATSTSNEVVDVGAESKDPALEVPSQQEEGEEEVEEEFSDEQGEEERAAIKTHKAYQREMTKLRQSIVEAAEYLNTLKQQVPLLEAERVKMEGEWQSVVARATEQRNQELVKAVELERLAYKSVKDGDAQGIQTAYQTLAEHLTFMEKQRHTELTDAVRAHDRMRAVVDQCFALQKTMDRLSTEVAGKKEQQISVSDRHANELAPLLFDRFVREREMSLEHRMLRATADAAMDNIMSLEDHIKTLQKGLAEHKEQIEGQESGILGQWLVTFDRTFSGVDTVLRALRASPLLDLDSDEPLNALAALAECLTQSVGQLSDTLSAVVTASNELARDDEEGEDSEKTASDLLDDSKRELESSVHRWERAVLSQDSRSIAAAADAVSLIHSLTAAIIKANKERAALEAVLTESTSIFDDLVAVNPRDLVSTHYLSKKSELAELETEEERERRITQMVLSAGKTRLGELKERVQKLSAIAQDSHPAPSSDAAASGAVMATSVVHQLAAFSEKVLNEDCYLRATVNDFTESILVDIAHALEATPMEAEAEIIDADL